MTVADYVLPLATAQGTTCTLGGKAASLAKLASGGCHVPDGFVVTTSAYEAFLNENDLRSGIRTVVAQANWVEPSAAASAANTIQSRLLRNSLPETVIDAVVAGYARLGANSPSVAIRSSATAEDLPEHSFAGQQDSFLNVNGTADVLRTIIKCYASLWSERAMRYRQQRELGDRSLSIAVIVQCMIDADVSGVCFTANPVSGQLRELVINANYGLGESVVSGTVTPDTVRLDRDTLIVLESTVGSKETMVRRAATASGTTRMPVPRRLRRRRSLTKQQVRRVAELSLAVERQLGGGPVDVEWAIRSGEAWLLQARPITALPTRDPRIVAWQPPRKDAVLVRRQIVEHMPEPLSPLFEDLYLNHALELSIDHFVADFGIRFDPEVFVERPMFLTVNGYAYCRGSYRWSTRLLWGMPAILIAYVRLVPKLLRTMVSEWEQVALPEYQHRIERWQAEVDEYSDRQLVEGVRELATEDARYWFGVAVIVGAAKVTDQLLDSFLSSRLMRSGLASANFLRGFPSKSVEAQQALDAIADSARGSPELQELFRLTSPEQLWQDISQTEIGREAKSSLDAYLKQFGHQVFNLDFAEPTLAETPSTLMSTLKSLVATPGENATLRLDRLGAERDSLFDETMSRLGPLRRRIFGTLVRWAQYYAPYREDALFYVGASWPTLRRLATELGRRLTQTGCLTQADDVFYLTVSELERAVADEAAPTTAGDLKVLATERRSLREARRQIHPPGILPPGKRWRIGPFNFSMFETQKRNQSTQGVLNGFAVSPGIVTGPASLIKSPEDFAKMAPNSILVCPTTTPAWTPLFSQATALVTDIGGILAHGSIVAREYGIPAVMGTGNATRRILHGQQITVDGNQGIVKIG